MAVTEASVLSQLLEKIENKTISVGVVGLGYVGLPFMVEKAKVGLRVIGIDKNEERIGKINRGENYISDVDNAEIKRLVAEGFVSATADTSVISSLDVVVICVPTPLDKNLSPDLQYVVAVTEIIAKHLKRGQLISLESTTYPGTTEEVIQPILETSGLKAGFDFFLAHSPERVDPGNQRYTTKNTNKVVGGINHESLVAAEAFYKLAIQHIVPVSSAKAAELVKVYENTYRAVNIALANEIALLCDRMNLNVWEVLDAAFTKPFGIMPFYPGPGVGGHCIPIDPHYLEWKAKEHDFQTQFISLAGATNRSMPQFVVDKAMRALNKVKKPFFGSKILMLGVAYKAAIDDCRESPALAVYDLLRKRGCDVSYHDSFVPSFSYNNEMVPSVDLTDAALTSADLVLITTEHPDVDYRAVVDKAQLVLDTRYATRGIDNNKVVLL